MKLWSIFTDDMDTCLFTHLTTDIERHHIFEGWQGFKKKSEQYGFIVPLYKTVHPNGSQCSFKNWKDLDHWLKRKCQEYYIEIAHYGSREDWIREFGKFYDDRADEKLWLNGTFEWRLK